MKEAYRDPKSFRNENRVLLGKINKVLDEYAAQGYRLTLRQLYYQLVVQNILENKQRNYAKLSRILGEARMSGLVDWDVIEDRIRVPIFPNQFESVAHGIDTLIRAYRLDRWQEQENYVEVWVEKDALSGVLEPITRKYHVRLLVNRGYSSISAMHEAAQRLQEREDEGKNCYILYFGDHDPSGEDMVRDIEERQREFGLTNLEVRKIALTINQVKEYKPPPNPAKMSDPRATGYVAEHGYVSWELDALPPKVLNELLVESIEELLDSEKYDSIVEKEKEDKEAMAKFAKHYE